MMAVLLLKALGLDGAHVPTFLVFMQVFLPSDIQAYMITVLLLEICLKYVCVYIHAYFYTCIYMYIYIYTFIYTHTYMYTYTCIHMYIYI